MTEKIDRLLRFPKVKEITGLSRTTVWRMEKLGTFPQHKSISSRMVVWLESEIVAWVKGLEV